MRILFLSKDLIAGDIAYRLVREGHEVKLYIDDKDRRNNLEGLVKKTLDWEKELPWVGKDGLIVVDDVGFGRIQEDLRGEGYAVFGGNPMSDRLELDREHTQKIFKDLGMTTAPLHDFDHVDDAIAHVKRNPKLWVIKQNDGFSKGLNYVGVRKDAKDVLSVLKNYRRMFGSTSTRLSLQEKVEGVEIAVARTYNGHEWVGPIKLNVEHKKFFPGDIGPTTSEMGTIAWCTTNEKNKLFQETLAKLEHYLQVINFRGEIDINCIVNKSGSYPLEATPRFGSPITHLYSSMLTSTWGDLLSKTARGQSYKPSYRKGFGAVVLVAAPPFPYASHMEENTYENTEIFFDHLSPEELDAHIRFEEVSRAKDGTYFISDSRGYILYVTGIDKTIRKTVESIYDRINRITIPRALYRNDIGDRFIKRDLPLLKEWGYF